MLTEEQFAEQQRALGRRIHQHDGVFWEVVYPFYCKPAFVYKPFDPGEARPARVRSLLGYSHHVRTKEMGNRAIALMVLGREGLDAFGLQKLPSKKRNNVRRALGTCVVAPVVGIGGCLERIREINIAQAQRQESRFGAETPVRRYTVEADAWRAQMRRESALEGREWWGAFVGGVLAAYLRTYQVEGVRIIQQTKADTAYLKYYPMDALYYAVLSKAAADQTCRLIVNGDPRHPSLNHFKEQFLFAAVDFPYYSSSAWLVEAGKKLTTARSRGFRTMVERGSGNPVDGG